jgi:hypothetical protein
MNIAILQCFSLSCDLSKGRMREEFKNSSATKGTQGTKQKDQATISVLFLVCLLVANPSMSARISGTLSIPAS